MTGIREGIEKAAKPELVPDGYVKVIDVEKLLCRKLGKEWSAVGISIASLIDDLATANAQIERPREDAEIARLKGELAIANIQARDSFYDAKRLRDNMNPNSAQAEIERLRRRVDDLLEANNRYQQEARDARRMAGKSLTAHGLADALDCFWNAAITEAHSRGFEAMNTASVMAVGLEAVASKLKETETDFPKWGEGA